MRESLLKVDVVLEDILRREHWNSESKPRRKVRNKNWKSSWNRGSTELTRF